MPVCGWAGAVVRAGSSSIAQKSIFRTNLRRPNWPVEITAMQTVKLTAHPPRESLCKRLKNTLLHQDGDTEFKTLLVCSIALLFFPPANSYCAANSFKLEALLTLNAKIFTMNSEYHHIIRFKWSFSEKLVVAGFVSGQHPITLLFHGVGRGTAIASFADRLHSVLVEFRLEQNWRVKRVRKTRERGT